MRRADVGSVVRLLKSGDAGAYDLVRARVGRIVAFRGYGIPWQDRSDLEQRILIEVWEAVSRPGFEPDGFWGFVEVVASRRCIDWLRARRDGTALDGVPSRALAINDAGQVIGVSQEGFQLRAFYWSAETGMVGLF